MHNKSDINAVFSVHTSVPEPPSGTFILHKRLGEKPA